MVRIPTLALALTLIPITANAVDWPQWRGPQHNGISAETAWNPRFGPGGPRKLWSAQVGEGFSSVAIVGGRAYTVGNSGGQDTVWCLDVNNGRPVWRYSYRCDAGGGGYGGPRATPTVDGPNVYTLSTDGRAFCLNAANGRMVWTRDLRREARTEEPQWGFAGSPLVDGNLVLFNVGTAGVACDKTTGRPAWISGPNTAGYSSPVPFNASGKRGVAIFAAKAVVAVNPSNGQPLWQYGWNTSYDVNAADPIISGDQCFISSNYGRGCALLNIGGGRASVAWQNRSMKNHFNSCVLVSGAIYGNDDGTLRCMDWRTGAERWSMRGIGKGGLISAAGKLIVLGERGELIIADANPAKYTEVARASVIRGLCWTHPVLANGLIYCRSHEGELVCLDLRGR